MRGKPLNVPKTLTATGITPAGAGKTRGKRTQHRGSRDHPRRCGENCHFVSKITIRPGSPPQVRGKQSDPQAIVQHLGITPAGAGKTEVVIADCTSRKDHPRRCGENDTEQNISEMNEGSPPQVRGKRKRNTSMRLRKRITPAGAGKTAYVNRGWAGAEDHPRRCGENKYIILKSSFVVGSPPQVRGKQVAALDIRHCLRITPAGAGKTTALRRLGGFFRDHPRRCGENASSGCPRGTSLGSPPQVRGKPAGQISDKDSRRITPAGAGKTINFASNPTYEEDHPRRCGENSDITSQRSYKSGSPPQVRGKHKG